MSTSCLTPLCVALAIALVTGGCVLVIGMAAENRLSKGKTKYGLSRTIALLIAVGFCCGSLTLNLGGGPSWPLLITRGDVVGTWYLTQSSASLLQRRGHPVAAHAVVFRDDGVFYMNNVPSEVMGGLRQPAREEYDYINGSGTWRLLRGVQTWEVVAQFQMINGRVSDERTTFSFIGSWPPYELLIWLGEMGGIAFYKE